METMRKMIVQAPGRINLLGEHLDYNQGIVLPAAIDRCFEFEFEQIATGQVCIEALDLNESWIFELAQLNEVQTAGWRSYVKGVFMLLFSDEILCSISPSSSSSSSSSPFNGLHIRFKSNIPIGAGLSSSAALCCGLAFGLNEWFDLGKTRKELALLAQETEHRYAGVQCGLMDQVASLFGKEAHLLAFDCLSQEIEAFQLPLLGVQLFLIDSKVKHNLAESAYNERRAQLESAWLLAKHSFPGLMSWRDINEAQLQVVFTHLDLSTQKRLRYVLDEMSRVQQVQKLATEISDDLNNARLIKEHYRELGSCINQTHGGLRDLYEVSCKEIDFLQAALLNVSGILGARMMGGGFGGCLLVLSNADFDLALLDPIFSGYEALYQQLPSVEQIKLTDGVQLLQSQTDVLGKS
jgi:galactokinase